MTLLSIGKITAYGVIALLIAALVSITVTVASADIAGGAGVAAKGSAFGGIGDISLSPSGFGPGFGFDSWGWGGLGPGGIVGVGSCGYNRHSKGLLWSPWIPGISW
jgi:hypothetical protein